MEGKLLFEGNLQKKWCFPNKNALKRSILVGRNRGAWLFSPSFCSSSVSREIKSLNSSENQLRSLDSYFRKLQNDGDMYPCLSRSTRKGWQSLDDYLGKLSKGARSNTYMPSSSEAESYVKRSYNLSRKGKESRAEEKISDDETSNLYLIGTLAAVNIAVFLFEIASPVKNSELQMFSLPMLYGAKINQLILVGEWWRLLTPMFLHAGVFHIGLSCWMLVSFGRQVCRWYGPFTFFLIYVLGGLSGNLISFLHTPDPTVCGTGPVFAIMGALIAYQIQNRALLGNNASEKMIQKAIIAATLSCTLASFGPVDDWTHIGGAFTGLAFGFLACPVIQLDDQTSESGKEEGIRVVTQHEYAHEDSCKSLAYFCCFILLWCSLLFAIEPPL